MVEALGGVGPEQALCVLLFTSANTVGRMVAGVSTERLLHRYGVPRWAPLHLSLLGIGLRTAA